MNFLQAQAFCICYYGGVMRLPSLEELAEKWTVAHTVAIAAWVLVVVLGVMLLLQRNVSTYPVTDILKVYAGENATFTYPENWTLNKCEPGQPFIELPGTIKTDYKGNDHYQVAIYGTGAFNCIRDRPEKFDIYPENMVASDTPCAPATSTDGERLENGLYLQIQQIDERVAAVHIKQNNCFVPVNTVVLGFAFTDPQAEEDDVEEFGPPTVNKEDFLASPQYQDIRALAESIRY